MNYFVTLNGRELEVQVDGDRVALSGWEGTAALAAIPGTPLRVLSRGGRLIRVALEPLGTGRWAVTVDGERIEVEVVDERARHLRRLTAPPEGSAGAGTLRAPMPGLVVRVLVEAGQSVRAGEPLLVLEAMKMENQLKAPGAGTVTAVRVAPGQAVEKGQPLIELGSPAWDAGSKVDP